MSESTISPTEAAVLADAVYGIRETANVREGVARRLGAVDHARGQHGPQEPGVATTLEAFDLSGRAIFGESGGPMLHKASGFGMVVPGKGRYAGDVAVVCRGTATKRDWLTNLNTGLDTGPAGLPVHTGFARTYGTMATNVDAAFRKLDNPTNIHVVGHSLGGALAALFAMKFASEGRGNVHLYTFGAPRAGTGFFTEALNAALEPAQCRRVYALADVVPMVPIFPFAHAMGGLRTGRGGQLISISSHFMENYRPAVWQQDWATLTAAAADMDDLKSVDHWVSLAADNASTPWGAATLHAIGMGLKGILKIIDVTLGAVVTGVATVLDRIVMTLMHGIRFIGEQISFWTRKLIEGIGHFLGRALDAGQDLTTAFLRYVLGLLLSSLATVVSRALDRLS